MISLTYSKTENSPRKATKVNDVYILNLSLCRDIQVKKEVDPKTDVPQMLNITKVTAISA